MRKIIVYLLLSLPVFAFGQVGIKAGLNFANVTNASSINSSSESGFHAGLFLGTPSKKILGFRSEIIFSRQGYSYKSATNTGKVNLDYILMPQLMCINITKFFQLQFGSHMAFLINAKADTTNNISGLPGAYGQIMSYYNKFDYGFAAGVEIHPAMGLIIGARYNISLSKLYADAQSGQIPSFSAADAKNNLVQLFAGWQFGNQSSKKKK